MKDLDLELEQASHKPKDTIEFPYIIANEDAIKFYNDLKDFCKDKNIVECHINITPIMAGFANVGGQQVAQMKLISSAFLVWSTTQIELDSFLFKQKMLGK